MLICVVAHCLLNPHTRVQGLAPAGKLEQSGAVIQLPCPELIYFGACRWEMSREQVDTGNYRRFCRDLLTPLVDMMEELWRWRDVSFEVVGISKSPSCACNTTTTGYRGGRIQPSEHHHIKGRGVLIKELERELQRRGVPVKFRDA